VRKIKLGLLIFIGVSVISFAAIAIPLFMPTGLEKYSGRAREVAAVVYRDAKSMEEGKEKFTRGHFTVHIDKIYPTPPGTWS